MEEEDGSRSTTKLSCLKRVSNGIIWGLETTFYRIGLFVGQHPWITIVFSLTTCGLFGLGLKTFTQTTAQERLWVPQKSRIINEKVWVDEHFPTNTRYATFIITGVNVITPSFLRAMLDYYLQSTSFIVHGKRLDEICLKVGQHCRVNSLLELWSYNATVIKSLSYWQIWNTVNKIKKSPLFGTDLDILTMLGGTIHHSSSGRIVGAEATQMTWILKQEDGLTEAAKEWELDMINMAKEGHSDIINTYVYASRSFDDEGYGAINSDTKLLSAGFSIVFLFVMVSLGKFNMVEQRICLSLLGLFSVGLAILFAYGVATVFDVIYGPIQTVMPFLLLGIGVDDMFVIVEAWKNLRPEEKKLSLPEKIGLTLKHAGVSVTVTSVTDVVAFGIGATTVIPALSAFCIYAALGIMALYVLQSTFFVACLTLDERRRGALRNACICCYKHKNYEPNKCSQKALLPLFLEKYYGRLLMKLPVKIIVVIVTLVFGGVFLWRFISLKQDFDLTDYIPSDSYAYSFARAKEKYFPDEGVQTNVYCGEFNYYEYSMGMRVLYKRITESRYIQNGTIISWFKAFSDWMKASGFKANSEKSFNDYVFQFLTGPGIKLSRYVTLNSTTLPAHIQASFITFKHTLQLDSSSEIKAMEDLRHIVDDVSFPQFKSHLSLPKYQCFAYTDKYLTYETNKVLQTELYRNLGLAGGCVLIVTLLLIANLWSSLLVFLCVVFTLIDVGGTLELWGVTIDTASSILLILAVGLAVDYSAHVGHTFMTVKGTRNDRAVSTLKMIGPAVFNGGFSTLLAFVLLANSASYGFALFFRVFFTVVIFGLFHGLAFLPVILSWVGPQPYDCLANTSKTQSTALTEFELKRNTPSSTNPDSTNVNGPVQTSNSSVYVIGHERPHSRLMMRGNVYIPKPDYSPPNSSRGFQTTCIA